MKTLVGVQIQSPAIKALRPVFGKWLQVIDRYVRAYHRSFPRRALDNPYWNGERSAVSSLSAAAWLAGGAALEEFATVKGKGRRSKRGRSDLWILLHGVGYAVEAKLRWPDVSHGSRGWETLSHDTLRWVDEAARDAARNKAPEGHKVGAAFIVPLISVGDREILTERCAELVGDLKSHHRNVAWWFLTGEGRTPSFDGFLYPGVAVVMKKA